MGVLVDTIPLVFDLVEDKSGHGKIIARGTFARSDEATANNRLYPGKIWLREIARLRPKIEGHSLVGHLDHPKDGKTSLVQASHVIRDLKFDGSTVVGELEVMGTPMGQIAKAILESGVRIGVSSRGLGSTRKDPQGRDVVQDDYRLLTFDLVADPAASTAWPEFATEDWQQQQPQQSLEADMNPKTVEELRAQSPELVKQIEEMAATSANARVSAQQKELEKKLVDMIAAERANLAEQIRGELMTDPEIGGAQVALESIKRQLRPYILPEDAESIVANKDEQINDLMGRVAELEESLEEQGGQMEEMMEDLEAVSRMLFMESLLVDQSKDERDRIVSLVGDVGRFSDHDEFKLAMANACERVLEDQQQQRDESHRIRELERRLMEQDEKLRKAIELGHALGARAYAERRLALHPHASALREAIDRMGAASQEDVDTLIESWDRENPPSKEFEYIHSRTRRGMSHLPNAENLVEDDDDTNGHGTLLGVSYQELQELSGIPVERDKDNRPY